MTLENIWILWEVLMNTLEIFLFPPNMRVTEYKNASTKGKLENKGLGNCKQHNLIGKWIKGIENFSYNFCCFTKSNHFSGMYKDNNLFHNEKYYYYYYFGKSSFSDSCFKWVCGQTFYRWCSTVFINILKWLRDTIMMT